MRWSGFRSLYPPRDHPWLHRMSDKDVEILKTTATTRLNRKVVIGRRVLFFDSPPGWVSFERNPGGIDPPFEGSIRGATLLPARRPDELRRLHRGKRRVAPGDHVPLRCPECRQPCWARARPDTGTCSCSHTLENHAIEFDLDQWGLALVHSPEIPVARDGEHHLEIFVGGQVAGAGPAQWGLDPGQVASAEPFLRIWLDGKPVWTTRLAIDAGSTARCPSEATRSAFSGALLYRGEIELEHLSAEETRTLVERNVVEGYRGAGAVQVQGRVSPGGTARGFAAPRGRRGGRRRT